MNLFSGKFVSIGAGNMAEALLRGALKEGVLLPENVCMTDIRKGRLSELASDLGVATGPDNRQAVAGVDYILLAVKPQVLDDAVQEFADAVPASALVISIAAGVTCAQIEAHFSAGQRVVRVMPNTPSLVGEGAAAVAAGSNATVEDLDATERIMAAVGLVVRVQESDLDAVTAVSGSGPAYVFAMIESLMEASERVGLPPDLARPLIAQTLLGAVALWVQGDDDAGVLRERVTSKGGTTEAALAQLAKHGVHDAWLDAVDAAYRRSRELSGEHPSA